MSSINLQLLLTGNELMTGDVIDTNSSNIAIQLKDLGISVKRRVTISDDIESLINEIDSMSKQSDILIINGGLGPTTDDLTSEALSKVSRSPLVENAKALNHLNTWATVRNITLDKANLKQAYLPTSAETIHNRTGSAVGIHININNCDIYCTPGVPSELDIMLSEEIIPLLQAKIPKQANVQITRLQTFGIGESRLQTMIDERFPDWPADILIGFRSNPPLVELKLITQTEEAHNNKVIWLKKIETLLNDHIVGEITGKALDLPIRIIELLLEKKLSITTAESCTGGLIASQITSIAGSSQVFEAGFVTYSNRMKETLLFVPESTLQANGAVSEQTVIAMVKGAITKSGADIGIAVSGIAGPSGDTSSKPLGTVWIAFGTINNIQTKHYIIKGTRLHFQQIVAARSLDLIRRMLIESKNTPLYS